MLVTETLQFQIHKKACYITKYSIVTLTYTFVQYQWKHNKDQGEKQSKFPGIPPVNSKPLLQNAQMHFPSILLSR